MRQNVNNDVNKDSPIAAQWIRVQLQVTVVLKHMTPYFCFLQELNSKLFSSVPYRDFLSSFSFCDEAKTSTLNKNGSL